MMVQDKICLKCKYNLCKIVCINCAKHTVYITNTNFNEEHSNMPIYKTFEKSWILQILRKESIFIYSKRKTFIPRIGVFTSVAVAIFRVTLRDRAQIFLKKVTIYKNDDWICFHYLSTDQMWRVKRMWHEKISLILCDICYSAS